MIPKQQPSNMDAERQVLGAIFVQPSAMDRVVSKLRPDDFYGPKHRKVFSVMLDLYAANEAIDVTTVTAKAPDLRVSASDIAAAARVPANLDSHVTIIKNLSQKREILLVAQELATLAQEKDLEEVQSFAKTIVTKVLTSADDQSKLLSPADQVELLRKMIEAKARGETVGLPTGFKRLDKLTGGLQRGNLIVLGARTSVGKSTFAENIAENAAAAGFTTMFVSIEMDPDQINYRWMKRYGASESILDYGASDDASKAALEKLIAQRMKLPLHIHNEPSADTVKIRAKINEMIALNGGIDLVIVDYLQLMTDTFGGKVAEHLRLGLITKTLKSMAREYEIPIVLITQLNRNSDQRGVLPEPRLSDIRESGRIEEDSDLILFLWNTYENKDDPKIHLKIAKNRQGPVGIVPIKFFRPQFLFTEPTDAEIAAEHTQKDEEEEDADDYGGLGVHGDV